MVIYDITTYNFDEYEDFFDLVINGDLDIFQKTLGLLAFLDNYDDSDFLSSILTEDPGFFTLATVKRNPNSVVLETTSIQLRVWNLMVIPTVDYGNIYGYPKCCQDGFYNFTPDRSNRPLNGTGYVPCRVCADLTEQELITAINTTRITPEPFPQDKETNPFILIGWLERQDIELGANLLAVKHTYPNFDFSKFLIEGTQK